MKADPRGVVLALRRAVHEGDRGMADFLTDEIVQHLEALDAIEAVDPELVATHLTPEPPEADHGD
jgi:hypothetical protein